MVSDGAYIIHTRMQCGKAFCGVKVIFQGLSGISRVHFEKKRKLAFSRALVLFQKDILLSLFS